MRRCSLKFSKVLAQECLEEVSVALRFRDVNVPNLHLRLLQGAGFLQRTVGAQIGLHGVL